MFEEKKFNILKSPSVIVDMPVFPCNSVKFYFAKHWEHFYS